MRIVFLELTRVPEPRYLEKGRREWSQRSCYYDPNTLTGDPEVVADLRTMAKERLWFGAFVRGIPANLELHKGDVLEVSAHSPDFTGRFAYDFVGAKLLQPAIGAFQD